MKFNNYLNEVKNGVFLPASIRKGSNNKITKLTSNKYHSKIPLKDIDDILKEYDMWLVDEAGEPWSGLLVGADSGAQFDLMHKDGPIKNSMLIMTWYKMPSGRYEIVAYLS